MRALSAVLFALLAVVLPHVAMAGEAVDLLLVLAADVSRSVDPIKFKLQRDGYAAAFSDPRVLEAVRSGPRKRIAVTFMEWSGLTAQRVVIDWMVIQDEASGRKFSDILVEEPRSFAERTSISAAIDYSVELFSRSPYEAVRRTIDISGDGTNNSGRDITAARDAAVKQDITINGLVILSEQPLAWNPAHTHPPGGLANYYRDNVIGGPGAFVMTAEDFKSFGKALINKLVAEIAMQQPPMQHAAAQ